MNVAQKALLAGEAIGGWHTIAAAVVSRALFLIAYAVTGRVLPSALVAVGAVAVFAAVRWRTERTGRWQAAIPLAIVGLSAELAGSAGDAVDFYLPDILPDLVLGPVFLVSMVIRFPVIGLLVGGARREWRHDRVQRTLYQRCTAVLLGKFVIAASITLPLYFAGQVFALGIAGTLVSTPALAACVYLCRRLLRAHAVELKPTVVIAKRS